MEGLDSLKSLGTIELGKIENYENAESILKTKNIDFFNFDNPASLEDVPYVQKKMKLGLFEGTVSQLGFRKGATFKEIVSRKGELGFSTKYAELAVQVFADGIELPDATSILITAQLDLSSSNWIWLIRHPEREEEVQKTMLELRESTEDNFFHQDCTLLLSKVMD